MQIMCSVLLNDYAVTSRLCCYYFVPIAHYCDDRNSVCVREHISETTRLNFTQFSARVFCGRGSVRLRQCCYSYVLPVFWQIVSRFPR